MFAHFETDKTKALPHTSVFSFETANISMRLGLLSTRVKTPSKVGPNENAFVFVKKVWNRWCPH